MAATIILDGKRFCLQPGFAALSALEKELSASVTELAMKLSEGVLTLDELATVIAFCIEPETTIEHIRASLLSGGISRACASVATMFCEIFCGAEIPVEGMLAMSRSELDSLRERFPD